MSAVRITPADLDDPPVGELLRYHHAQAHAESPSEFAFALDIDALRDPAISVFAGWRDDRLVTIGALRALGDGAGEVKSMRTAPGELRQGHAQAMLSHLIAAARGRGWTRLLLETGNNDAFAAARRLYARNGFVSCGPFGDYRASDFNVFYALTL